jgi:hypothetical protein
VPVPGLDEDEVQEPLKGASIMERSGTAKNPMDVDSEQPPPSEGVLPFNASSLVSNKPVSLTCCESDDC